MLEVKNLTLDEITVPERARQDLGDLKSLQDDISRYGLLYPILVNDSLELCDGGRRLEALKNLGETSIPARVIPGLTPDDSLVIEWLSNVSRKDFSWPEEIKLKLKIHEQCKSENPNWGYLDTGKKLGVSKGSLTTDLGLAYALRYFPDLEKSKTKAKAKEAYNKICQKADAVQSVQNLSDSDKQKLNDILGEEKETQNESGEPQSSGESANSDSSSQISVPGTSDSGTPSQGDSPEFSESRLPSHVYEICDFRDLLPKLPDEMVGFAELDPPYAIKFEQNYGQTQNIDTAKNFTDWTPEELYENISETLRILYPKLVSDSWILCWTGMEHFLKLNEIARSQGYSTQLPGFWVKPSGSANSLKTNMISDYETFLLFRKGKATFNTEFFKSCKFFESVPARSKYHPTQKPLDLYHEFFKALGKFNYLFVSPFAGSGASMIAATMHGMTPVGCDLTNEYYHQFIYNLKENSSHAKNKQSPAL